MKTSALRGLRLTLLYVGCVGSALLQTTAGHGGEPKPGSAELPLRYQGPALPNPSSPDGGLPFSPGVQNIQVYRSNRRPPSTFATVAASTAGYTYNHHQDIACWKGRLYVAWAMGLKDEDVPPSQVMFVSSRDGFAWSEPRNLFPPGMGTQLRFYFYRAANDRMLVFACGPFQSASPALSERYKRTLLVRELMDQEQLGPVYTLINPGTNLPPAFAESPDPGFVAACREAYQCRLLLEQQDYGVFLGERRMKWHDKANWPGGKVQGKDDYWTFGKAFCFFHRPDHTLVGLCKLGFVTQSSDEGETWSFPVVAGGLNVGGAKEWAQRTPDGRYAMVYPPQRSPRYPMVVTTSDDGITFQDMRVIHGEVPPQRYQGLYKDMGPQYLRGVAEWAGDAPSLDKSAVWVVYSVNKENIWVSRIPVPIVAEVTGPVHDTFDKVSPGARAPGWNTYAPAWAPVRIAKAKDSANQYLELEDREPADYARAVRLFPASSAVEISFRLAAGQNDQGRLEIDLLGERGTRPVRVVLNGQGRLLAANGQQMVDLGSYPPGRWSKFSLKVKDGSFSLSRDAKTILKDAAFAEPSSTLYALSLRTGEFRGVVSKAATTDLLNTEDPSAASTYRVDDVVINPNKW